MALRRRGVGDLREGLQELEGRAENLKDKVKPADSAPGWPKPLDPS